MKFCQRQFDVLFISYKIYIFSFNSSIRQIIYEYLYAYYYGINLVLSLSLGIKLASLTFSIPKSCDVILLNPIVKPPCGSIPYLKRYSFHNFQD